jgi:aminoglycoside 6'-N-acetyltransferase I
MRQSLWPEELAGEHHEEIGRFFAGPRREPLEVLLALDERGAAIGFAELSIRNVVDSCTTDRVGYLEGWYVDPRARRRGVGRALIAAAERWALQQGCTEFGSDVLVDNQESQAAHRALGFQETARVCCFRKDLGLE